MSLISGYICFVYTVQCVHIQLCKQSCFFPFNLLLFTSWLLYILFHCMLPDISSHITHAAQYENSLPYPACPQPNRSKCLRHEIFAFFFSWIEPIWVPDKQSKMVSLKNLFWRRYSQKTWLCALYWAESDSPQYYTARSWEIEMSKNPQLANSARSRTLHSVILQGVQLREVLACAESNNFCYFQKFQFPGLLGSLWWYLKKKNWKYFENPKLANTAPSLT